MSRKLWRPLPAALVAACAVALLLTTSAGANGGRPPVFQPKTTNVNCGDTLSVSIVLNGNLDCSAYAGTAVTLDKGVKFDLGGHTLTVDSGHIGVYADASNAVVTDGTITGGTDGVEFDDSQGDQVTKTHILSSASYNVYLYYDGAAQITSNTLSGPDYAVYSEYGQGNVISKNTISGIGSGGEGVSLYYDIRDQISSNMVSFTSTSNTYGFYDEYSYGNTFTSNTSSGGYYGFYIDEDDYGPVYMKGNTAENANQYGFYTYYDFNDNDYQCPCSSFVGNKAINNGSDGFYSEYDIGSTWSGNTATSNGGDGFVMYYPYKYIVKSNTATLNADAGFYFESDDSEYAFSSIASNTADTNSDYGFYSDYFIALGAGNKAKGNSPYDCYLTTCPVGSSYTASTNP